MKIFILRQQYYARGLARGQGIGYCMYMLMTPEKCKKKKKRGNNTPALFFPRFPPPPLPPSPPPLLCLSPALPVPRVRCVSLSVSLPAPFSGGGGGAGAPPLESAPAYTYQFNAKFDITKNLSYETRHKTILSFN